MKKENQTRKIATIIIIVLIGITSYTCKKDTLDINDTNDVNTDVSYSNVQDFFNHNGVQSEYFTFNNAVGGTFTSVKGSQIIITPNTFVHVGDSAVTGNVTLEFKDVYNKSDMVLTDISTENYAYQVMSSAGMFFIRVKQNSETLDIAPGKKINVIQPSNTLEVDSAMAPFVAGQDSFANVWFPSANDTIAYTASGYIYSMYNFSNPIDSGTWCNSDNPSYFANYTQTTFTAEPTDDPTQYGTQVFLLFTDINGMVHVYMNYTTTYNFPYYYAPLGANCTLIAIGVKDEKLYYAKKDITITQNMTTTFSLTETTTNDFINLLKTLN
ncbi:MAG TPA: hypothetical protein PKK00_14640 [Bacteroidales bacterium]|nr:hypothetical protein [Bacteroidales bacterium]HPS18450.1 hypothetical protein [Bacteroidales bacterium]